MPLRRFRYGPRRGIFLGSIVFFGACGVLFVRLAHARTEVRLWPLGVTTSGAPVLVLAAGSFSFVLVACAVMIRGLGLGPRELVVGEDFLEAPASPWSRDVVRVERSAIRGVRVTDMMGTRVVELAVDGRKIALSNRTVGSDGYAAVVAWLERR